MMSHHPGKQDKQAEIDFFDEFGEKGSYDVITEAGYQRILAELLIHCGKDDAPKVLDLGCGTGSFTERLARRFPQVIGLDISPKCIASASRRYGHIRFATGDMEALPYPDRSFDIVTLFGVLHHFPRIADALQEPHRILKDNGILFTYDPNLHNPFFWIYHSERSPLYSAKTITKNEKLFAKPQLKQALLDAQFRIEDLKCVAGVTLDPRHRKYSSLVRPAVYLFNGMERLLDLPLLRNALGSSIISISRK